MIDYNNKKNSESCNRKGRSWIEAKDKNKATPLALAAWKLHCNAIRQLIDAGANTQALNGNLHKTITQCETKEVPVKHRNSNGGTLIILCKIY